MKKRIEDLQLRFLSKGFTPIEIQGLIEDVFKILSDDLHFTRDAANQEMEELGWGIKILDKFTYNMASSLV